MPVLYKGTMMRWWPGKLPVIVAAAALAGAACGGGEASPGGAELVISAIPDQDPELLQRLYGDVSAYFEDEVGVPVRYEPVTDYAASVSLFKVGDLDLVWFGGLTGVHARLQVPGAHAVAQRDIDDEFRSVFIGNRAARLQPVAGVAGLARLRGTRFTFGSEISTSGRLMPQYFLDRAGVGPGDFDGEPGFSGDHDKTIKLVESGTYEAGALNSQVWDARVAEGAIDTSKVVELFRTPPYYDYHWVLRPDIDARFGDGVAAELRAALVALDGDTRRERNILELFGARRFVATRDSNYERIEMVARKLGLVR